MDIIRRIFGHKHLWKFAYNHGIPLGTTMSIDETLDMLHSGKAYAVDECTRCLKQSRLLDGKRVLLSSNMIETP